MNNKKGILPEEVMKLIISVLVIVGLVYLAYLMYSFLRTPTEVRQAQEIVKQVASRINALENKGSMKLAGPKCWFLYAKENQVCVGCKNIGDECERKICKQDDERCIPIKKELSVSFKNENQIEVYFNEILLEKQNGNIIISKKL